jgi:hypothetical protein
MLSRRSDIGSILPQQVQGKILHPVGSTKVSGRVTFEKTIVRLFIWDMHRKGRSLVAAV